MITLSQNSLKKSLIGQNKNIQWRLLNCIWDRLDWWRLSPLSNEHGRVDESVGTVGQAGLLTA